MRASNRIIVNTFAQYIRTIFNMVLSLYSTRLILEMLGVEDYGLFTLIAGIVSLLSFVTNSLVSSTQRFLSVAQGQGDIVFLKNIFNTSLLLHIGISLLVIVLLELLAPFWFNGFLNIPNTRIFAAEVVYQQVLAMLAITFISSPFRALLVSHENIVYISLVDMADGILKVVFVVLLSLMPSDKLILYGWAMLILRLVNFFAYFVYDYIKYKEFVFPFKFCLDKNYIKQLSAFIGWTMLGTSFTIFRNQGITIILNKTMGAVVNAAYGIGFQVSGMIGFVSSSLGAAIDPQLMKAEGGEDRNKMMYLARFQSKFSYFLLSMFAIPCIFEIETLLGIWLKEVPKYSSLFVIMFLVSQMVDQLTMGLSAANKAVGDIKMFTIIMGIPKFLELPLFWLTILLGFPLYIAALSYVCMEFITMFVRIPLLKQTCDLNVIEYVNYVFGKIALPTLMSIFVCYCCIHCFNFEGRFILTFACSIFIYAICIYIMGLESNEKKMLDGLFQKTVNVVRNKHMIM